MEAMREYLSSLREFFVFLALSALYVIPVMVVLFIVVMLVYPSIKPILSSTPEDVQHSDIRQYRGYYAECLEMTEDADADMCGNLAAIYASRK